MLALVGCGDDSAMGASGDTGGSPNGTDVGTESTTGGGDGSTSNSGSAEGASGGSEGTTGGVDDCMPPQIDCAGACVDPASDPLHCGGCGRPCGDMQSCLAGECSLDESSGLQLISPEPGYERLFVDPEISWAAVEGATGYDVIIARDAALTDVVAQVEGVSDTSWTSEVFYMADVFHVRVEARPGGEFAQRGFVVRGVRAEPDVVSPTVVCDTREGVGTKTTYAVAVLEDVVYASRNVDGAGICRHGVEDLSFIDEFGAIGGNFRSFGVASDPEGDRLFATFFPFVGSCGDSLERMMILEGASSGRASLSYVDTGMESGHTVIYAAGRAFSSGLLGQSCWQTDTFCLDLGEPCPDGAAAYVAWDVENGVELTHSELWGAPGGWADEDRVYRGTAPGVEPGILVQDAATGELLATVPVPSDIRGIVGVRDDTETFLVTSQFDQVLRIYAVRSEPPSGVDDIVLVNEVAVDDRYWQGDIDSRGRMFFPAQDSLSLRRHDLAPTAR